MMKREEIKKDQVVFDMRSGQMLKVLEVVCTFIGISTKPKYVNVKCIPIYPDGREHASSTWRNAKHLTTSLQQRLELYIESKKTPHRAGRGADLIK